LDAITKRELDIGARLLELLKQDQYKPAQVERQVASIWAAIFPSKPKNDEYKDVTKYQEGMFVIDIPIEKMLEFERELLSYLDGNAPEILQELREKQKITAELEKAFVGHVTKFKEAFVADLDS
jgi:F-type H+-transporting ATPase subunit alpha